MAVPVKDKAKLGVKKKQKKDTQMKKKSGYLPYSTGKFKDSLFDTILVAVGTTVFAAVCVLIHQEWNHIQPTPYMDEEFHVPQVQKFCKGIFNQWDDKITTLPGLYFISLGMLKPLHQIFQQDFCNIFYLRFLNSIFAIINIYIIYKILCKLQVNTKELNNRWAYLQAFTLATLPTLYFFTFLYYTDTASTFFVLLTYLLHLEKSNLVMGAVGAIAVFVRQTNIFWILFITLEKAISIWTLYIQPSKKMAKRLNVQSFQYLWYMISETFFLMTRWKRFLSLIWNIIKACWTLLILIAGFGVFVFFNGSIVVGDKSAHQMTIHLTQVLYFSVFAVTFAYPFFVSIKKVKPFFTFLLKKPVIVSMGAIAIFSIVYFCTLQHPYLLADNRHYTFYIWRRIFMRHDLIKYLLTPVYFGAIWCIFSELSHKTIIWKIGFALIIVAATCFHLLLEFRYFILPYLMLRMHMKPGSYWQIFTEFLTYCLINALTFYLFLSHTFTWENSPNKQRFMW